MSWITLYQCDECGEVHETQLYAQQCCAPDVNVVYGCDKCDEVYEDMDDADECCKDQAEAAAQPASDGQEGK